jgi:hypothetical protein
MEEIDKQIKVHRAEKRFTRRLRRRLVEDALVLRQFARSGGG